MKRGLRMFGALTALFLFVLVAAISLALTLPMVAQEPTAEISPAQLESWQTQVVADAIAMTATAAASVPQQPIEIVDVADVPTVDVEDAATNVVQTAVDVANLLSAMLIGIAGSFIASPATQAIVSVLKRIPALDTIPANTLALFVGVVLWAGAAVSGRLGVETQYGGIIDAVPILIGLLATLVGAPLIHKVMVAQDVAVLGYIRSEPRASPK